MWIMWLFCLCSVSLMWHHVADYSTAQWLGLARRCITLIFTNWIKDSVKDFYQVWLEINSNWHWKSCKQAQGRLHKSLFWSSPFWTNIAFCTCRFTLWLRQDTHYLLIISFGPWLFFPFCLLLTNVVPVRGNSGILSVITDRKW